MSRRYNTILVAGALIITARCVNHSRDKESAKRRGPENRPASMNHSELQRRRTRARARA